MQAIEVGDSAMSSSESYDAKRFTMTAHVTCESLIASLSKWLARPWLSLLRLL